MLELDQVAPSDEISAQAAQVTAVPAKFAALRNADCRPYLFGAALVVGGVANLAAMSIGQTVVQLLAPPTERGRVIGVYGMSANGLRAGSGFTVGLLGAAVGVHWSLGLSSVCLCLGTGVAGYFALRPTRGRRPEADAAVG